MFKNLSEHHPIRKTNTPSLNDDDIADYKPNKIVYDILM